MLSRSQRDRAGGAAKPRPDGPETASLLRLPTQPPFSCGTAGDDRLEGGAGADTAYGDGGVDRLEAGDGDDVLAGGPGRDRLEGGAGTNHTEQGG